jgi:hypothetical protein
VDFLTLVDNWRGLLELRLMYTLNLAELEASLAELEQAVGADLPPPTPSHQQSGR